MSASGSTDGWVRACHVTALGENEPVHVDIGQCPVCLVRSGGAVYALRDECTHQAVPLSDGEVAGGAIECWLHGSRFDLATGRVLLAALAAPVALSVVLLVLWAYAGIFLDRRRMAAWDADWAMTGPQWSGRY